MTIEFVGESDMFAHPDITSPDHIPVVAVNTIGVMGAGQALAYRQWDEKGCQHYRSLCEDSLIHVGEVCLDYGHQGNVLFFPTMVLPGSRALLLDIARGAWSWAQILNTMVASHLTWHVPQLGCGVGRLHWPEVASVLTDLLSDIEGHTFLLYGPDPEGETAADTTEGVD